MSVWITVPSARPIAEVAEWAKAWRDRGYHLALWRDDKVKVDGTDVLLSDAQYPGYASAVNELIANVMELDPDANWFIAAGDDVYPDPNHSAEEIEKQCHHHLAQRRRPTPASLHSGMSDTYGVMQPTGDRWGENPHNPNPAMRSAYIDRVCGSAWIGREFVKNTYGGKGPLWHEYFHMYVDQELQEVATKLGVLWQRRDLTQEHRHWGRQRGLSSDMPAFLKTANEGFQRAAELFLRRRAEGFKEAWTTL